MDSTYHGMSSVPWSKAFWDSSDPLGSHSLDFSKISFSESSKSPIINLMKTDKKLLYKLSYNQKGTNTKSSSHTVASASRVPPPTGWSNLFITIFYNLIFIKVSDHRHAFNNLDNFGEVQ